MNRRAPRPATLCIHGTRNRTGGTPLVAPIVRSSIFQLDDAIYAERAAGHPERTHVYTRETNPTLEAVEARLAALEGAQRALVFASGMAALHAVLMATLERGDEVLVFRQIYGGTIELCRELLPRLGVALALVDVNDWRALEREAGPRTRLVLCESISNPLTAVADLPRLAALLRERAPRAAIAVDATLASPIAQRPLEHGAAVVWHSATKVLAGHSDLIGGVVAGNGELMDRVWKWRYHAGGCMDPEAAFLLDRGLKTLGLRVRAHSENALAVARFLAGHPEVAQVNYCGLESHPHHALARSLLAHTGGLLSFVVKRGDEAALALLRRLTLFAEAASLGSVESLANRPRDLSHAALSEEERAKAGIAPGLVRVSVGIEDPDDLIADLGGALAG